MALKKYTLGLGVLLLFLFSCSDGKSGSSGILPSVKTFYAYDFTSFSDYEITADLLAENAVAGVYVERGHGITSSQASSIVNEFQSIYSLIRNNFYYESDVDNNGKIIIFLLDIRDGFSGTGGFTAGYFFGGDTLNQAGSNLADMIYMDVDPLVIGSGAFNSTLAHEFQHLVSFNCNYLQDGGLEQDTWINEGLSAAAEYLYNGNQISSRIEYYNNDPEDSIKQGNNFFIWDGSENDVLADYSTVYLFFQWLRIHSSTGSGIYKDILTSSYTDYRSVESAAESLIYGSSADWTTILRDWLIANVLNENPGIHGYKNEISTNILMDSGTTSVDLAPGEQSLKAIPSGDFTPSSNPAASYYIGIDTSAESLDSTEPYSGDYVLVFNSSVSQSEVNDSITVSIPNTSVIPGSLVQSLNSSQFEAEEIYPISVRFGKNGSSWELFLEGK